MAKKVYIITGPIGSGKSTAIKYLKDKGLNTVDLDKVSNDILNSNQSIAFLKKEFPQALVQNGVNRAILADIVFKNKDKLTILENYLHPKVLIALQEIIHNTEDELFVEVSAPKNIYKDFDCIVIYSQVDTRIKRLQERGMNYEDIQNRIANQKDDDWWKNLGIVIENDNLNDLYLNLEKIINQNS
jgi:dephospho-CoA kinase